MCSWPSRTAFSRCRIGSAQSCHSSQCAVSDSHFLISMSGRGNCSDNVMAEIFFKTIKAELIWQVVWQTREQARNAVARYIDGFYNPVRRHSALGSKSPI